MAAYLVRQELQEPCLHPNGGIASGPASHAAGSSASGTSTVPRKRKRETVSSSNVLASSDTEDDADDSVLTGCTNNLGAHNDELDEYLALPQIENTPESACEWRECSCVVIIWLFIYLRLILCN